MNKFAGVIFDFDGTVIDNEGIWETAFVKVMNKFQIPKTNFQQPNGWWHEPGAGLTANWKRIGVKKEDIEKLTRETVKDYINETKQAGEVIVREGIDEMVEKAKDLNMPTALCTGNAWYMVEDELEKLQLYLAFDVTTTGEEAVMPKPDPEIYLLTLQKMGVEPEECLVIEDSLCGIRLAVEAGTQVVGLISSYATRENILAVGAKWAIESIFEVQELLL